VEIQFLQICVKISDDSFHIKVLTLTKKCSDLVGAWWNFDTELKNQNSIVE
jgi:hypothetical protein